MKARIKYRTPVLGAEYVGGTRRKSAIAPDSIENSEVVVVDINEADQTVRIIDPLDPQRILTIAAEAVELYNEAVGVWQTIVSVAKKIGAFFKRLFSK